MEVDDGKLLYVKKVRTFGAVLLVLCPLFFLVGFMGLAMEEGVSRIEYFFFNQLVYYPLNYIVVTILAIYFQKRNKYGIALVLQTLPILPPLLLLISIFLRHVFLF